MDESKKMGDYCIDCGSSILQNKYYCFKCGDKRANKLIKLLNDLRETTKDIDKTFYELTEEDGLDRAIKRLKEQKK